MDCCICVEVGAAECGKVCFGIAKIIYCPLNEASLRDCARRGRGTIYDYCSEVATRLS